MEQSKITVTNIAAALLGVFLICMGVAFNNCAGLGNDSVGMIYDGIRHITGMTSEQLGTASSLVNLFLVVLLLFVGRRYISVGTLVYFLPYGFFVNMGKMLYPKLQFFDGLANQIVFSVAGCLLLYMGVAIFITVDIGVDPFTGVVLVLRDRLKREYRLVKICFDITMIVLGTAMGGKLGAVTIITAFTAGPGIQFFSDRLKRLFVKEQKAIEEAA